MRESHYYGLNTSISRIEDNFSRLTHKSGRAVLKKTSFHFRFVMYYFSALYSDNRKSFQMSSIRSNRINVFEGRRNIFGNISKSSKNRRKSSEVARTFSKIPVMTRQKFHPFDSGNVGRYRSIFFFFLVVTNCNFFLLTRCPQWHFHGMLNVASFIPIVCFADF